ncbi:MAG: hypothetical protein K0S44_2481 [Bacteroidetes bacterium]|jgi:hypothetical protein|nr:hypothetical protein [Bacteroidota bacterium]
MAKRVFFVSVFFICVQHLVVYSQSIQRFSFASGAGMNGNTFLLESNIGELVVDTYNSGTNLLTQGFIQNDDFLLGYATNLRAIQGKVFPNPVSSFLHIELELVTYPELSIEVYDMLGKRQILQLNKHFKGSKVVYELNFENINSGFYFVKVISADNRFNEVFKVTKV